jgi:hypothetical protein
VLAIKGGNTGDASAKEHRQGGHGPKTRGSDSVMPMTLLIDGRGRIAATHAGVVSRSDCPSEIETLLKEKGTATTIWPERD